MKERNHIIATIRLFVAEQKIDVYKDGVCMKTAKCTLNEIADMISVFSKEYGIKQIDLKGNTNFCLKLKEDLTIGKYTKDDLSVTIY